MIYLYDEGTTDFANSECTILSYAQEPIINEELNGRFDISFKYPIFTNNKEYKEFKAFKILYADTPKGKQAFFITKLNKGEGFVKVEGKHVFFLLDLYVVSQLDRIGSANWVCEGLNLALRDTPLVLNSTIDQRISAKFENVSVLNAIGDGDTSIIGKTKGELDRNNYTTTIRKRIGIDTEFLLAKRKNINDFNLEIDNSNIVTRLNVKAEQKPEWFIPKPNGKGKLATAYPSSGGISFHIKLFDGARGGLIVDGEGSFDVYDSNGYKVFNNIQTGSRESVKKQNEDKKRLNERIAREKENISKAEESLKKANESLTKAKASNSKTRDSQIKNAQKRVNSANERLKKAKDNLAKLQKELNSLPTIILGERLIKNGLPSGTYTMVQTRSPNGYTKDVRVKEFTISKGQTTVINWYNNPDEYKEDQRIWVTARVDSPLINEYPYIFEKTVELKASEEEFRTKEELINWAKNEFKTTRCDLPTETISFNATSEMLNKGLKLGDTAVILYSDYGLYKDLELVEIEYDPMAQRYISMVFGEKSDGLKHSLTSGINGKIADLSNSINSRLDIDDLQREQAFSAYLDLLKEEWESQWQAMIEISNEEFDAEFNRVKQLIFDNTEMNLDELNKTIAEHDAFVTEMENKYGTVDTAIKSIKDKNEELDKKVNEIATEIDGKLSEIDDIKNEIATEINTEIQKIDKELSDYILANDGEIQALKAKDGELSSLIGTAEQTINGLNTKYSSLKQTVDGISTKVTSQEKTINGLDTKYTSISQEVGSIKTTVASQTETIDGIKTNYSNLKQTVDGINTKVASQEKTINGLNTKYSSLKQTVDGIQTYVARQEPIMGSLITSFSRISQKVDEIISIVYDSNGNSVIQQLSDEITLRVTADEVQSMIKQSASEITLTAEMITNAGLVRFTDIDGSKGTTTINGSVIKTGTINADKIKVDQALIDKLMAQSLIVNWLKVNGKAFVDEIYSYTGVFERIASKNGFVNALDSKLIVTKGLKADNAILNEVVTNKLNALTIRANKIVGGYLESERFGTYGDGTYYGFRLDLENNIIKAGKIDIHSDTLSMKNEDDRAEIWVDGTLGARGSSYDYQYEINSGGFQVFSRKGGSKVGAVSRYRRDGLIIVGPHGEGSGAGSIILNRRTSSGYTIYLNGNVQINGSLKVKDSVYENRTLDYV